MAAGPYLWFLGQTANDGEIPVFDAAQGRFAPGTAAASSWPNRTVVASGPVLAADAVVLVDSSAGPVQLNLLAAATFRNRLLEIIHTVPDNTLTIEPAGAETINNLDNVQLAGDGIVRSVTLYCDGSAYWIF